jgi:phosphoserine phosphatase
VEAALDSPEPVLCVDLDGTLARGDSMVYCARLLIWRRPWYVLGMALWHGRGRAALKDEIARRVNFDPARLTYEPELVSWLRAEQARGRKLVLASGSDRRIVAAVARYLGLFDDFFASDGKTNLTGPSKVALLSAHFPAFDYVGDSRNDLAVWRHARLCYLVARRRGLARRLSRDVRFARIFDATRGGRLAISPARSGRDK